MLLHKSECEMPQRGGSIQHTAIRRPRNQPAITCQMSTSQNYLPRPPVLLVNVNVNVNNCAARLHVLAACLPAWDFCGCALIRPSTLWLLPFTALQPLASLQLPASCSSCRSQCEGNVSLHVMLTIARQNIITAPRRRRAGRSCRRMHSKSQIYEIT